MAAVLNPIAKPRHLAFPRPALEKSRRDAGKEQPCVTV